MIPLSDLLGTDKAKSMLEVPISELCEYAAEDADYTLRLYQALLPQIESSKQVEVLETVDMPLVPVLANIERQHVI